MCCNVSVLTFDYKILESRIKNPNRGWLRFRNIDLVRCTRGFLKKIINSTQCRIGKNRASILYCLHISSSTLTQ
jgi:hypothetical protein